MRYLRKVICMLLAMLLVVGMVSSALAAKKTSNVIVINALEQKESEKEAEEIAEIEDPEETEDPSVSEDPEAIEDPEETEDPSVTEDLAEVETVIEVRLVEVPFPEDATLEIFPEIEQLGEEPAYGDIMHLISIVSNLDGYELQYQWEQMRPGGVWLPVEGATGTELSIVLTPENVMDAWRLTVTCFANVEFVVEVPEEEEIPAEE